MAHLSLTFREMLPPIVAEELDQLLVRLNSQLAASDTSVAADITALTSEIAGLTTLLATLTAGVELVAHKGQPSGYAGLTALGVVPIAQGGTRSGTALVNGRVMVSSGGAIVENSAGTSVQVLYGGLAWGNAALTKVDDTNVTLALSANAGIALVNATSLTLGWTGTLAVTRGGTGLSTVVTGDLLYGSATDTLSRLADVAAGSFLRSGGVTTAPVWSTTTWPNAAAQGDILYASATNTFVVLAKDTNATRYLSNTGTTNNPAWAQVALATGVSGVLPVANGGTNINAYAVGDILYASGATTLSLLNDVATGNALISGGVTTAPSWGKIGLTTHVSGVLAEANGGTNQSTYAQGDVLYASAANTLSKLAKNTTATRYLSNTGTTNNPAWAQINIPDGLTIAAQATGDILYASSATVWARLAIGTSTTVLHGGTIPAYAAVSLTADVSGDLPFANLAQGSALSVLGVTGNATADVASIAAASDFQVLRRSGTAVAFGAVDFSQAASHTGTLGVGNGGTGTASMFTASAIVFAGTSGIYTQDAANLSYDSLLGGLSVGAGGGAGVGFIILGGPAPTSGALRMAYGGALNIQNRTNNASIGVFSVGGIADDDFVEYGDNSQHGVSKPLGLKFYPGSAAKMVLLTNGAVQMNAYGAGVATFDASGNITSVSDSRLKTDITLCPFGRTELAFIKPRHYRWTAASGYDTKYLYPGFLADEVAAIPSMADVAIKGPGGYYGNPLVQIVCALVNTVNQLTACFDKELTKFEQHLP